MGLIEQLKIVKKSAMQLLNIDEVKKIEILNVLAEKLEENMNLIIEQNKLDLAKMSIQDPKYDRLELNKERIIAIANDVRKVALLESPLNKILEQRQLPNGIELSKKTVPLGVVAVIYESRPNVTIDVFSLCFKSGNAIVLKGGSDAYYSNLALVDIIKQSLLASGLADDIVHLMPTDRQAMYDLLNATGYIDVCIPRGSQALIQFVRDNAKIPVIETGAGIVHTYVDASADTEIAKQVIYNAKTRRVSVCNALDCLVLHQSKLSDLVEMVKPLADKQVIIYADRLSYKQLMGSYPVDLLRLASSESFGCEFLDYKLAIKTVADTEQAIEHIAKFSSGHSEAIIANDNLAIEQFTNLVDAAVVYVNVSTAFTDGGEFGLGAEIGISTQKLHAQGPMALAELTSYKWIAIGNGQVR